ncbi:MAG: protein-L-isoaspartate(D-aspartate) O-methyltransferase [Thermodesulfobacteriota bacterium]|jgi:protein-L-isoaspartate(D-aspartate) O-methyltransferase|nr:MAG: protein-L-isoaspartate(D-aspartate) O-methyltransferase [Thermodesulfobacteriota bacterium]
MNWREQREQMVKHQLVLRGIKDQRVLEAMRKVPRHFFVPEKLSESAYHDGPLSIGEGQTISQPYMVALMTECLGLKGGEKVLEIGTGSGYQTAVLAELAEHIYTIERIPILLKKAQQVLTRLGYTTITFKGGDGTCGWEEESPFDGIIVTAGAPDISPVLVEQLDEGGVLVIPVGTRFSQSLFKVTKKGDRIEKENYTLCVFVPLIGMHGWKEN